MIDNVWTKTKVLDSKVQQMAKEGLLLDEEDIVIDEKNTLLWLWLNADTTGRRRYAEVKLSTLKCICGACYLDCLCHKPEP